MARATHQWRTPAAHLRLLNAEDYGPRWIAEVVDELANGGGGTLVLTHLDQLPHRGRPGARRRARAAPRVHRHRAALGGRTGRAPGPAVDVDRVDLLEFFPRTVVVPPLRHHVEDVAELVPHLSPG